MNLKCDKKPYTANLYWIVNCNFLGAMQEQLKEWRCHSVCPFVVLFLVPKELIKHSCPCVLRLVSVLCLSVANFCYSMGIDINDV